MKAGHLRIRKTVVGAVLLVGIGMGAAACSSSSHNNPATQTNTGGSNAPTQTSPPTTAPSGSVSY